MGVGDPSAKAILAVLQQDILDSSGCLQLCAGQCGSCEVVICAMRKELPRMVRGHLAFISRCVFKFIYFLFYFFLATLTYGITVPHVW